MTIDVHVIFLFPYHPKKTEQQIKVDAKRAQQDIKHTGSSSKPRTRTRASLLPPVEQVYCQTFLSTKRKNVSFQLINQWVVVAFPHTSMLPTAERSEANNCSPGLNSLCHVSKSLIVCLKNRVVVVCWIIYNSKQELRFALKRIICNNGIYHGSRCKTKLFALLWSPHQGMQMRMLFF